MNFIIPVKQQHRAIVIKIFPIRFGQIYSYGFSIFIDFSLSLSLITESIFNKSSITSINFANVTFYEIYFEEYNIYFA